MVLGIANETSCVWHTTTVTTTATTTAAALTCRVDAFTDWKPFRTPVHAYGKRSLCSARSIDMKRRSISLWSRVPHLYRRRLWKPPRPPSSNRRRDVAAGCCRTKHCFTVYYCYWAHISALVSVRISVTNRQSINQSIAMGTLRSQYTMYRCIMLCRVVHTCHAFNAVSTIKRARNYASTGKPLICTDAEHPFRRILLTIGIFSRHLYLWQQYR